jgi:hypothetical protein
LSAWVHVLKSKSEKGQRGEGGNVLSEFEEYRVLGAALSKNSGLKDEELGLKGRECRGWGYGVWMMGNCYGARVER